MIYGNPLFFSAAFSRLFAAIGVTYPPGSVLTCTNGEQTFKAKNTSGQWVFAIPEPGDWTVTATDGVNSRSLSVSITTEGQFESVALSHALILFDGGDNTAITGGWEDAGNSSFTTLEVGETIYVKQTGSSSSYTYRALCKTVNMIPMNTCNQLEIVIDDVTKKNTTNSWSFGVFETITSGKPDYIASITFDTDGTYVLDVSEITGDYYVGFSCGFSGSGSGRSMAMTASKVIGT